MAFIPDDDDSPARTGSARGHNSKLTDHPPSPQRLITALADDGSILAQSLLQLECGCLRCPEHVPRRNPLLPSCEPPACDNVQQPSGRSVDALAMPSTGNTQVAREVLAAEGEYDILFS